MAKQERTLLHVGGINYVSPVLIVANHLGSYFESVPPLLLVYFLYPRNSWVRKKKKEYDIKGKVRIKKDGIIQSLFPSSPFFSCPQFGRPMLRNFHRKQDIWNMLGWLKLFIWRNRIELYFQVSWRHLPTKHNSKL